MDCSKILLIVSLASLFSIAISGSSWRPCSSEGYIINVRDVTVSPDPAIRGGNATFDIPAVSSDTITGGRITVQVYYMGVPVHTEDEDLCYRTSCPIMPGDFSINNSADLPGFTPTGNYRLDMRIQDENGDLLTCLKINFRIAASSALSY